MIDSFITSNYKRPYFLSLTEKALTLAGFCPILVDKPLLERYFECEKLATSDLYILSDDDVIPATRNTLRDLIDIMRAHPEYSQLGLNWRGLDRGEVLLQEPDDTGDIWDVDSVGRLMVIRKGTIKDFGYQDEFQLTKQDSDIMAKTARRQGFKVGIVPNLYFHNLG